MNPTFLIELYQRNWINNILQPVQGQSTCLMLLFRAKRSIYTGSIGKVVASYAPLEPSARPSIFTKEGVRERLFRIKNSFRNVLSSMYLQRTISDYSKAGFLKEATSTYMKFLKSFLKSDSPALRAICSPNLYEELNERTKNLSPQQNYSIVLASPPKIVQILPVKLKVPQLLEIFQITVQFEYTLNGHKVKDYVVFERSVASSIARWKICGNVQPNDSYYKTP